MTIFYKFGEGLYVNVTNRCPCDCVFCIRQNGDCVGDSQSLWLEREPTVEEIISDFERRIKPAARRSFSAVMASRWCASTRCSKSVSSYAKTAI